MAQTRGGVRTATHPGPQHQQQMIQRFIARLRMRMKRGRQIRASSSSSASRTFRTSQRSTLDSTPKVSSPAFPPKGANLPLRDWDARSRLPRRISPSLWKRRDHRIRKLAVQRATNRLAACLDTAPDQQSMSKANQQ